MPGVLWFAVPGDVADLVGVVEPGAASGRNVKFG
jgi:hypothetical protein